MKVDNKLISKSTEVQEFKPTHVNSTEVRRIIKFGNSSHVISVPHSWIKENGLKKGDLIYLEKNSNGELVLMPKERKADIKEEKVNIDVEDKDDKVIEREIIAAYIKGFTKLSITSNNIRKKLQPIEKVLKNLVGIEIFEKNSHEIIAADFLDVGNISIRDTIRRMDIYMRAMFEDLTECLENKKITQEKFNEIYETDYDINKLYFLLWRIAVLSLNNPSLLQKFKINSVELIHTWWLSMNLEHIGDELKRIARDCKEKKLKNDTIKKFLNVLYTVKEAYLDVMKAYHKENVGLAYEITSKKHDVIKKCDELAKNDVKSVNINEKLKAVQSYVHNIAKCIIYFT